MFLLVRGKFAWLGFSWMGCNTAQVAKYLRPPQLDEDYGEPTEAYLPACLLSVIPSPLLYTTRTLTQHNPKTLQSTHWDPPTFILRASVHACMMGKGAFVFLVGAGTARRHMPRVVCSCGSGARPASAWTATRSRPQSRKSNNTTEPMILRFQSMTPSSARSSSCL